MDASDIGFTLAFPAGLLDGLEAMASGFELLDAAAAAGGDDAELADQAFEILSQALAPAGELVEPGEDGVVDADAAPSAPLARPVPRQLAGGLGGPVTTQGAASRPAPSIQDVTGARGMRGGQASMPRIGSLPFEGAAPGRSVAPDNQAESAEELEVAGLTVLVQAPVAGLPVAPTHGGRHSAKGRETRVPGGRTGGAARRGNSGLSASVAYARGAQGRMLDAIAPIQADTTAMGGEAGQGQGGEGWSPAPRVMAGGKGRNSGTAESWDARSMAPGTGSGGPAARTVAAGGGLFQERAVAPQPQDGGGREGGDRPVILDGRLVGQWLSERMARDAARPGAGTTFFDPRQAPAWTPSGVL